MVLLWSQYPKEEEAHDLLPKREKFHPLHHQLGCKWAKKMCLLILKCLRGLKGAKWDRVHQTKEWQQECKVLVQIKTSKKVAEEVFQGEELHSRDRLQTQDKVSYHRPIFRIWQCEERSCHEYLIRQREVHRLVLKDFHWDTHFVVNPNWSLDLITWTSRSQTHIFDKSMNS